MAILAALIPLTGVSTGFGSAARLHQAASSAVTTGAEGLDNATDYFDHARKRGFPAAGQKTPYVLRAEFTTRTTSGAVMKGTYTDTWVNEQKWRREATIGESRFVRSRNGKKWYRVDDGPDAALLQFVLTAMEPIPATDTGRHEEGWKMQRAMADGKATIQVWRGKENSDGTPDPKEFEGYWFNAGGELVRSYLNGLDIKREQFEDFNGVHVARQLQVILTGKVGMRIDVSALQPAGAVDSKMFTLKGNGWRHYTSEVR
jgi:hypothetical protein